MFKVGDIVRIRKDAPLLRSHRQKQLYIVMKISPYPTIAEICWLATLPTLTLLGWFKVDNFEKV